MPVPKQLLGKIATRRNLIGAWKDVSQSARPLSHGYSNQTIDDFRADVDNNLEAIRRELLGGNYSVGKLRAVTIRKKSGGRRPLRIADIRDRVVQRATTRVLEKYLTKRFNLNNACSHAYLRKKGVQSAILQMLRFHQQGCPIVLEVDIQSFFDSVPIDNLLRNMIFPSLPDHSADDLIDSMFRMEIGNKLDLPDEDWSLYPDSATGLPQGGYLSPLFANVYLSNFDKQMQDSKFKLIRYADDFIVMCETDDEAEQAYALAQEILENQLGLKLHPRDDNDAHSRTRKVRVSQKPIQFLGVRFDGKRIRPAPEKRQSLSEKLATLHTSRDVRSLLNSANILIEGWIAAYSFTDLNTAYAKAIDDEVNMYLWTALTRMQWKLKPRPLSDRQRTSSGVTFVYAHRDKVRSNLKDRELLSRYWTK